MNTVRTAAVVRIMALLSAIWTSLMVVPIFCWQVMSWILTGEWSPFPISRALALAGLEHPAIYVTAGLSHLNVSSPDDREILFDWLLNFPTTGLLLIVAAILLMFSITAASVHKQLAAIEDMERQRIKARSRDH